MSVDTARSAPGQSLAASTTVGAVTLTVADLPRAREFYERVIGLVEVDAGVDARTVALGARGGRPLVVLHGDPNAAPLDPRSPGLFHLALLHPGRRELADSLLRVAHSRWPLTGASDHLVSEALYLRDPDGNGIELYRDRPRERWPHDASGALEMDTLALDLDDLLAQTDLDGAPPAQIAGATVMGHVHLQISDVPRADAFYTGVLGFDATVRTYPGALFVSAGGYHHHLGLNTWNSRGSAPAAPGAVGLAAYEIVVPDGDELARIRTRLAAAAVDVTTGAQDTEIRVRDPFGTPISLRVA